MLRAIATVALASIVSACTGLRGPIEDPKAGPGVAVYEWVDGGVPSAEVRVIASDVSEASVDGVTQALLRAELTLENDSEEELRLRPEGVSFTFVETKRGRLLGAALGQTTRQVRTDEEGRVHLELELTLAQLSARDVLGFGVGFAFERAGEEHAREVAFSLPASHFTYLAGASPIVVAAPSLLVPTTLEGGYYYQPPATGVVTTSPVYAPTLPPPPSPHLPALPSLGGGGPTPDRVPAQPTIRGRD